MATSGSDAVLAPGELALEFDALRGYALTLIQRLAGDTWTDHNSHDPGITILEALCYVLTDLGYRTAFDLPDLLGGGSDGDDGLFTPAQVLTSAPVTLDDLRKLVIDVAGVKNAWIEPFADVVASYDAAQQLIEPPLAPDAPLSSPNISPVSARGLYRVSIEKSGWGEDVDGGVIVQRAVQRLQRYRGLGEDFAVVEVLATQPVALDVALEIDPGADPTQLLAALYEAAAAYMSPVVPMRSLREMQDRGWRVDQIFEGPLLDRGFIDPDDLAAAARRDSLRLSDLIHLASDLPGVLAVTSLSFLVDGRPSGDWLRSVDPQRCAALDIGNSSIRLQRRGVRVDHAAVQAAAQLLFERRMRAAAARSVRVDEQRDLAAPAGRERQVGRYRSVLEHFPLAWGVGAAGLSGEAPAERRAQASQLKAYLQFFDQLLANQFAQLAGARSLFALDDQGDASYFSQPVPDDDGALGLAALRVGDGATFARRLQAITEDPWQGPPAPLGLRRRSRILDHLLARFGERYGDHTLLAADDTLPAGVSPEAVLARDKQAFLRDFPRIGHDRGVAQNLLDSSGPDSGSGLALRLARRFGLRASGASPPAPGDERFTLVEHVLLRPLAPDREQRLPLFRAALAADPFSLRITLVFAGDAGRLADANFRAFVEQTARDETPAHLALRVLWFDAATMAHFEAVHAAFVAQWRQTLEAQLGLSSPPPGWRQAPLRSLRNRLIDLLGIGDTAPLPDLHLRADRIKVAFGAAAVVVVEDAEDDVDYELRGPDGLALKYKDAAAAAQAVSRHDGVVELTTPAITDDVTLRVRATKRFGSIGARWLDMPASIKVGLDAALVIELLDCPVLDTQLPAPQPGDARLVDWGRNVQVQIDASQEGVEYQLLLGGAKLPEVAVGNLGPITLSTGPVTEDVTIGVQATKRFPTATGRSAETQPLNATLALKVRANPGQAMALVPAAVVDHGQATVLRLAASQASARYRLFARRVRDSEWQRDDGAAGDWLAAAAGLPRVAPPARQSPYELPPGFAAIGDAVVGSGAALDLVLPPPDADSVILVQATKTHVADPGDRRIDSQVLLDGAQLLLVRPDARVDLRLRVPMAAAQTGGSIALAGGERGVFYALQPDAGPAVPLAGYFHQRDDVNPAWNKGLGQLAMGIDFALAGEGDATSADLAATPPPDPELATPALPAGTRLTVQATRAQTGLQATLARQALIAPLPEIALRAEVVDPGAAAEVKVVAAVAGERYQLWRDGLALGQPQDGSGADLTLASDPLAAAALLELVVERQDAAGLAVQRVVRFTVAVRPDASLAVVASDAAVRVNEATTIVVQGSERDVVYQLVVRGTAIGTPQPGSGGDLALPSGPISVETIFAVAATRDGDARSTTLLAATVTVALLA